MTALAAAIGIATDRLLGEPPTGAHPVAKFGDAMNGVERVLYRPTRVAGAAHTATGVAIGAATGVALRAAVGKRAAAGAATALAVSGKMLSDVALQIGDALTAGQLDRARELVPSLVGRQSDGLSATEIARAVVESVAENTIDAVVAPVLWAVGLGAPGALAYRAVNTLDAMVGHRSDRYENYGWASARLDDIANWVPARVGAAAVMATRPRRAGAVMTCIRRDAEAHPSPNGGVIEAAFAGALGVRLGGVNVYEGRVDNRGPLGDGPPPIPADIGRAVTLSRDVALFLAGSLTVFSVLRNSSVATLRRCRFRASHQHDAMTHHI
jgi:adenosylcobinamide-phosphate synthase